MVLSRKTVTSITVIMVSAEITFYGFTVIVLLWELFENGISYISTVNIFRASGKPVWNFFGDVFFAGMVVWYLLYRKVKWL